MGLQRARHYCATNTCDLNHDNKDLPGGPVVKTSPSNAGCASSTSDREDKIPHAFGAKKPKQNRNSIVTNSIETLKTIHIRTKSLFLKKKNPRKLELFPRCTWL